MAMICGIDEAGRGPLLGPLVVCGFMIEEKNLSELEKLGVTDSKLISPKKRKAMFEHLTKYSHHVVISSPQEIDFALTDPNLNLNWLEALSSAKIINNLAPKKVFVDCPSTNIPDYRKYIKEHLNVDCEVVCEHKADLKYLVAGAASIIAKVTRDDEIEKLKEIYGDLGSGYPSDPKTKLFLEQNYDKCPEIFRKSWQCYKNIIEQKTQKSLGDF
ncbi:ribonuclease HII [Candidatus Woesearchaeota archaeon]|jgi:ribonuclease HII|nr:ribonuclease HII [Candidatus Woesearchaeota archaeon]